MFGKKQFKKKTIIIYIVTLLFTICGLILLNKAFGQDLMEQAFFPAMSYDTVVDLGNTKNAVGNTMLRETTSASVGESVFKKSCFINEQILNVDENKCTEMGGTWKNSGIIEISAKAPLIVRITKFLLRMTIVLSITMVIFNAVKYLFEVMSGKDRNSAESKKNLIFVAAGVVLALMSVSIINLVISVPKSSLKTSDDLSAFEIGCKTGSTIVAGNDLKKWICINSSFGHDDSSMQYREWKPNKISKNCYICESGNNDCDRKSITNNEMKSKCVEDMGGTLIK